MTEYNMYLFFVSEQVNNRTALCGLLNGTCVVPANCAVLGLTLGFDYGRGSSSDIGKYFSCDAETICCYPFLLSSLSPLSTRYLDNVNNDDYHQLNGFETVFEYWYPNRRQLQRRRRKPTNRRRGYYKNSKRTYRASRSPFFRFRASA